MVIYFEVAEPNGKVGSNSTSESRVECIHLMDFPLLGGNGNRIFGPLPNLLQLSDNPHIRFRKLFSPLHIRGFIGQEERNVLGVRTQEESFLAASLHIPQYAHTKISGFIPIADGTEPDNVRWAVRWLPFDPGATIDKPCSQ
jgi:hypothetical protein